MAQTLRILVVDDKEIICSTLRQVLEEDGYAVTTAGNGAEALALYKEENFPIVITDIYMPQMTGLELLTAIKQIDNNSQVIVMTSYASIDTAISTLRAGAYDYLTKPFEDIELVSKVVRNAAEKIRLEEDANHLVEMLQQKTEQLEAANSHLRKLAARDGLTGLYNHRYFQESLTAELHRANRYERPFSLLFIDLDYFKNYNDTLGHLKGDKLLTDLANLFTESFRRTDIICRYGGDEFAVILPETSKQETRSIAAKLHEQVANHPFQGCEALPRNQVTISIGFATYGEDGTTAEDLLHHADQIMYAAKKNRGHFGEPEKIYSAVNSL